ncbi:MAG: serine hydrolase [Pelobium sp.]
MKKSISSLCLSFVFFLSIHNCEAQSQKTVPQKFNPKPDLKAVGTTPQKISGIDSLLQSYVNDKKVTSVVGFVAKGGNIVYNKAFGLKDPENNIVATPEDYYVLFSQTKAIASVAFMTLVEKGLVSVNDPVSKYFPEISDQVATGVNADGTFITRPAKTPMTFAHLLSHSSGLNAGVIGQGRRIQTQKADSLRKASGNVQADNAPGQRKTRSLKENMEELAKYPLGFDPGSEWSYHISTTMLSYMVERISGKSFRDYVKETVLIPLGMNDTDWYYDQDKLNRFVKIYTSVNGKLEPSSNAVSERTISADRSYAEGALGLNGPIEDYAKFCQMMLNKGTFNGKQILKPETIEQMTTINQLPEINSGGKGFKFGLGFQLYNDQREPTPQVSNTAYAWGGAYGTEYIIDPENDLIALFYINMPKHDPLVPGFLNKAYQLFK